MRVGRGRANAFVIRGGGVGGDSASEGKGPSSDSSSAGGDEGVGDGREGGGDGERCRLGEEEGGGKPRAERVSFGWWMIGLRRFRETWSEVDERNEPDLGEEPPTGGGGGGDGSGNEAGEAGIVSVNQSLTTSRLVDARSSAWVTASRGDRRTSCSGSVSPRARRIASLRRETASKPEAPPGGRFADDGLGIGARGIVDDVSC